MCPSSTSSSDPFAGGDPREVPDEVLADPRFHVPAGERIGIRTVSRSGSHRRRNAALSAMVAIGMLLVAEVAFRVAPSLPPPVRWDDTETQYKEAELKDRATEGTPTAVVYLGSSIMDAAIAPGVVSRSWPGGRNGYNAAIEGMDGRSIAAWAQHVVEPTVHPRVVVIGISPRELNDNGANQASFDSSFFGSRGWREAKGAPTFSDRLTSFAERHSALVRSRSRVRDPYNAVTHWRTGSAAPWSTPNVPGTGRITEFDDGPYRPPDQLARRTVFNRYQVGGRQLTALRRAIRVLQRRGVEVVLVEPAQVTPDLEAISSEADLDAAHEALVELSRESCSPLIDLRESVPDRDHFYDQVHVNREGSARESQILGERLEQLALGPGPPGCR